MGRKKKPEIEKRALETFRSHGGILRSSEAIKLGIHPRTLYALRDKGMLEELQRGLYCLPGLPFHSHPDLVTVSKIVPNGVICLVSSLFFHGLTTQIPHFIYIALEKGCKPPHIEYPPSHFYLFSHATFHIGIETHDLNGVVVKCYSKEKTIVDCFRFRNRLGIDVAIEALKKYWHQGQPHLNLIVKFAKAGRVEKIMRPYIEAIINESS